MKALPKRKGNLVNTVARVQPVAASMKVPPKRKGNPAGERGNRAKHNPSMKVPPKRKGNCVARTHGLGSGDPQ